MADEQKNELAAIEDQKIADAARERRRGHRRTLTVSPEGFLALLKYGGKVAGGELPSDTDLINAGLDLSCNVFVLVIESESFDFVEDGKTAPQHPPITFRAV